MKINDSLDHCGKPDIRNHMLQPWQANISKLSALPNVMCKVSGLVTEAAVNSWNPADVQPYIEHVINVFGPQRVMFGSDAPVAYLASTYDRWVQTLENVTSQLREPDK